MTRRIAWPTLAVLLAVMTAACGGKATSVQDFMDSAGQVESITLSDIYDRDVSDVVIVCPYTPQTTITDELGFDWPGAKSLAKSLGAHDAYQGVIALHDGDVVESEVVDIAVLSLCEMDLRYPATIDAGTTMQVSSSSWSDGTTYPVTSLK